MIFQTFLLTTLSAVAFAGSLCPSRDLIYPCSCINIPTQKKNVVTTSVSCHRLHSSDSFEKIIPALRTMQIDVFHLYDSFWEAATLEKTGEDKKTLPLDWMTLLKVKEYEIVDSTLSQNFACKSKLTCRNSVTQRFTAINSSSHEKITTLCNSGRGNVYSWTNCMSKLSHFHFSYGKLTMIDETFFPSVMKELTVLNLTHNEITSIKPGAFRTLLRLKFLDLSHNQISSLKDIFNNKMNLEFVDLSWNSIQTLGDNFFAHLSYIKTFKASNNLIVDLEDKQWKNMPESLKNVDLSDNPLHCDCSITWVNSTFDINVVLLGRCETPEDYANSLIRKASRALNQRCDGSSIGTRYRTRPTPALKFRAVTMKN